MGRTAQVQSLFCWTTCTPMQEWVSVWTVCLVDGCLMSRFFGCCLKCSRGRKSGKGKNSRKRTARGQPTEGKGSIMPLPGQCGTLPPGKTPPSSLCLAWMSKNVATNPIRKPMSSARGSKDMQAKALHMHHDTPLTAQPLLLHPWPQWRSYK